MIEQLPVMPQPDWLSHVDSESIKGDFPLNDVLRDSLYYPACGHDGDPVAYLAGNFVSFVYVDYGESRKALLENLEINGFRGYSVIAQREILKAELVPNGWTPIPPHPSDGNPHKFREWIQQPFCEWFVFQRADDLGPDHGPHRFSFLYLCADGVAAYQALYVANGLHAAALAIIQPGHGFGGNWTNFTDPDAPLARSVLGNPAGKPSVLLYGGSGGRNFYQEPCWREYPQQLCFLGNTSIGVWRDINGTA